MVLNYDKEEIFRILSFVLGEDADGIYCSFDEIEGNICESMMVYSTRTLSFIIEDYLYNAEENYHIETAHGANRFTIIPSHLDYVIKLSITGLYDYKDFLKADENADEENPELAERRNYYDPEDMRVAYEFHNVDLMEQENAIYNEVNDSLRQFLLPYTFVGTWHGIKVYIQKKVSCSYLNMDNSFAGRLLSSSCSEKEEDETIKSVKKKSPCNFNIMPFSDSFVIDMIKHTDLDTAVAAIEDTLTYLFDIHDGNYGYTEDGFPCIFDYGGVDFYYDYIPEDWNIELNK